MCWVVLLRATNISIVCEPMLLKPPKKRSPAGSCQANPWQPLECLGALAGLGGGGAGAEQQQRQPVHLASSCYPATSHLAATETKTSCVTLFSGLIFLVTLSFAPALAWQCKWCLVLNIAPVITRSGQAHRCVAAGRQMSALLTALTSLDISYCTAQDVSFC